MRLINLMNDRFKPWARCHGCARQVILFPRTCHNQLGEVTSLGLAVSCITVSIKSVSFKYHVFFEPLPAPLPKHTERGPVCASILRNNAGLRSHNTPTAFSETPKKRQLVALSVVFTKNFRRRTVLWQSYETTTKNVIPYCRL